ncbi:MAG: hydrogenase nickel incorporation protein HypB [Candidatus Dormibacteraeota bacterium]|nr:hydrogenase nickel incorporation protein HypB [Candidatus Dormibacteraeota bacterium]
MAHVTIARDILEHNDHAAAELHAALVARGVRTMNVMSSPGAGKTTLLERTIERLSGRLEIAVVEGDIATSADAERIEAAGAQTVQINTRGACHLEAHMVTDALGELDLSRTDLLVIENVGNLVCPAGWRLGEDVRVVLTSTTEGDDKPAKYPDMFRTAHVLIVNKVDLMPYLDYDLGQAEAQALALNPDLRVFELSCRSGEGLDAWCEWVAGCRSWP